MLLFMPLLVLTTSFQLTLVLKPSLLRPRQIDSLNTKNIRTSYFVRSIAQICISVFLMALFAINNHNQLLDKLAFVCTAALSC